MNYKLEIKPTVMKGGQKYKVIQITDLQLHTTHKTPTPSVGKKIQKAFKDNKAGRIYSELDKAKVADSRTTTLELIKSDPDFIKIVREEEAKGYKVLISIPKGGIPVFAGPDTTEFVNSKNGKRIIRGLAKEKDKE